MKLQVVSSIVLLVSLASTLPLSQATKLIFDRGNVIGEGKGSFDCIYNYNDQKMHFHLMDEHQGMLRIGNVIFGGKGGSSSHVMQMSFVLELTGSFNELISEKDEDQVWYQESSASLLEKVDEISGTVAIRELHASERVQMDKFNRSHDASHQFNAVYQNGAIQIQSNVKTSNNLNLSVDLHFFKLQTSQGPLNKELFLKEVSLKGIKGKSFVVKDAAKCNCERPSQFQSLGMQGYCLGNIWIEKL